VWPWNLTMIALVPCVFWKADIRLRELLTPGRTWIRRALFAGVVVLPALSLAGLWDTYSSFALYSGNPLNGSVVLTPAAWERLDTPTKSLAENISGAAYRLHLKIGRTLR